MRCDLVVPVFNGLSYVRDCVESILEWSGSIEYRLFIVDDASDSQTKQYLRNIEAKQFNVQVHTNQENLGFVKSCNIGIRLGDAPYVVLVNSDVVVSPGWLERLLECAESDSRIGAVNPLTNYASQIGLPMAPGANFLGMDLYLQEASSRPVADVVTCVGFCLLLRRIALDQIGIFDEIYGRGYCEESDLCMRLTTNGWRTVVAENVYVYHKGKSSFRDSYERYRRNRAIFDSRWKHEYRRQYRVFRREDPLGPVRGLFETSLRWDPVPAIWETARSMHREWKAGSWFGAGKEALRGGIRTARNYRLIASPQSVAKITRPNRLRVTYVLQDIVVAGGVFSVIQIVNELILLGVEARIVATFEDPIVHQWTRLYTKPVIFRSAKELVDNFPETDIVIATLWTTAPWVAEVRSRGKAKEAVYFIQDYESWFFPEEDHASRRKVKETYSLFDHRIVKSEWLKDLLQRDGYSSRKIELGMDLGRFYPRDVDSDRSTILAMARPGTPRRGFEPTIKALHEVKATRPELRVVLFGSRQLAREDIPFEFQDEGIVYDHEHLALLYTQADVFLDGSEFQGLGRCGLEAMACGTACVLTGVGGVTEYARNGENAVVVPPAEPRFFAKAVLGLVFDRDRKKRFIDEGLKTVQHYSHKREANETHNYLEELLR